MNCECCGNNGKTIEISYDIYPLIPPKKAPFPINLFKKDLPNFGIKKTAHVCNECFEDREIIIKKLEKINIDMVVCHVERIPEKENVVEKVNVEPLVVESNGTNCSIESEDLSK